MRWEDYIMLNDDERALVRFRFVVGLVSGEVQARLYQLALARCGVFWCAETGRFVCGEG